MVKYENFLNTIGTYWDLLELDKIIQIYQEMMIKNINEKYVYENLKNTRNNLSSQKNMILENNKMK